MTQLQRQRTGVWCQVLGCCVGAKGVGMTIGAAGGKSSLHLHCGGGYRNLHR